MATPRLSMRNTREILRQKFELKKTHREIATSLSISAGKVGDVAVRAKELGLTWQKTTELSDDELETCLYGSKVLLGEERPLPDPRYIHLERKRPGVTLELLHHEYLEQHPNGYGYTQFCERYRQWVKTHRLSMRQEHRAGEKLFVDFSGI